MMRKVAYLTQEAVRTLSRHRGITTMSVVIMSLSLLMLAVFLLATDNVLRVVETAQRDMKVYVYLRDGAGDATVRELTASIAGMPEVETVVFVSRDEALADFRRQLGDDADLLEALDENPLPDAFQVTPRVENRNRDDMAYLAGRILQLDGVEEVRYGREFLDRFASIVRAVYYADAIVGFIVILSAVFIISNAVRLTVISRRRTIEILRLVGATNRFIMTPFVMEGALQGGLAALLSLALLFGVTAVSRRFLPDLAFFTADKATLYVALCIAMGSMGSFTALRRYLKVR